MIPMLDCDAVMRQLWDFLDGELNPERIETIEAHVAVCERCHPQLLTERGFKSVMREARGGEADTASLGTRVRRALRSQGFAARG